MRKEFIDRLTWDADKFREQVQAYYGPDAAEVLTQVAVWLARGDGAAVYENHALDSATLGGRKIVSFGSPAAQLETDEPPVRLPDIGADINWKYVLIGMYREKE